MFLFKKFRSKLIDVKLSISLPNLLKKLEKLEIYPIPSLFLFLVITIIINLLKKQNRRENLYLYCPIRGRIGTKKYDESGFFTEEYYRIKLIKSIINAGFSPKNLDLNYRIRVGHGGKNLIIPDIVIKKNNGKFFAVFEVKKNPKYMKNAILYQLEPAMRILNSDYGVYFDGTKKSTIIRRNGEILKNFDFLNIPRWFFYEWKRNY